MAGQSLNHVMLTAYYLAWLAEDRTGNQTIETPTFHVNPQGATGGERRSCGSACSVKTFCLLNMIRSSPVYALPLGLDSIQIHSGYAL